MNCGDINELAPLWHSGEMEAAQHTAFDGHVASCPDCAAELRDQSAQDARLRKSVAAELVDTHALERRVMGQIARERRRRWLIPGMAAAAAVLAAVLLTTHHSAPANPALYADAARDHTVEVIGQSPRRWRTDPLEIAALETTQGISGADVKALEATGYHLQRAKICRLGGTPYMHMVYANGGREFSVYLRVRDGQAVPETESNSGNLQLASFARGRVQAVIVTDAPRGDCAQFARAAEGAL